MAQVWLSNMRKKISGAEDGNSSVEFIGVVAMLMLPTLYIMTALTQVQAATFAAESSANEIARLHALSRGQVLHKDASKNIAELAFADQGLDSQAGKLSVQVGCEKDCTSGGELVQSTVRYRMSLPLLGWLPKVSVTVDAQGVSYTGQLVATN